MNLALPLDQMSTSDKLRTMESLWDNLCENSDELVSPSWHKDVLADRDGGLALGTETIHEWSAAKRRIQESI